MYTEYIQLYLLGFFITMLILINFFKVAGKVECFSSQCWISILFCSTLFPAFWILLALSSLMDLLKFLLYEIFYLLKKIWKSLIKNRNIKYSKHLSKKNEMQKIE